MFPPLPIFSLGNCEYAHDNTEKKNTQNAISSMNPRKIKFQITSYGPYREIVSGINTLENFVSRILKSCK